MEIVIEIPEEAYNLLKGDGVDWLGAEHILSCVEKGKVLPKGHGDLVDRNAINERFNSIYNDAINCSNQSSDKYLLDKLSMCLDTDRIVTRTVAIQIFSAVARLTDQVEDDGDKMDLGSGISWGWSYPKRKVREVENESKKKLVSRHLCGISCGCGSLRGAFTGREKCFVRI